MPLEALYPTISEQIVPMAVAEAQGVILYFFILSGITVSKCDAALFHGIRYFG